MKRIRETLDKCFDEYMMSDELTALKEEILANATDHFDDLVKQGIPEEEAEATVLESLGDIRTLLRELGAEKKQPNRKSFDPFESDVFRGFTNTVNSLFSSMFQENEENGERSEVYANIDALEITGIAMDIHICPSRDEMLHVNAVGNIERLSMEVKDSTLHITENGTGKLFSSGIDLDLAIPETLEMMDVHLVSGDFLAETLDLHSLRFQSVSGDLTVKNGSIGDLAVKTTSGDFSLNLERVNRMYSEAVSGDAEVSCTHGGTFAMSSMSGDIEADIQEDFENLRIKTRSGDVTVRSVSRLPVNADLGTISGSVDCSLPSSPDGKDVSIRTISGDILLH